MKNIIIISILIILTSCKTNKMDATKEKKTNPIKTITWLKEMVANFEKEGFHKQKIEQYTYKDKEVYMVYNCYQCPDALTYVYDKDKNVVCEFGGFTGKNTCPDFEKKATQKKLLYTNIESKK